jgi:hypothetical protein
MNVLAMMIMISHATLLYANPIGESRSNNQYDFLHFSVPFKTNWIEMKCLF